MFTLVTDGATLRSKSGLVVFGPQHTTYHCTVQDVSPLGVRIKVDRRDPIPNAFVLVIEDSCVEADCQIVSRNGLEVWAHASPFHRRTLF